MTKALVIPIPFPGPRGPAGPQGVRGFHGTKGTAGEPGAAGPPGPGQVQTVFDVTQGVPLLAGANAYPILWPGSVIAVDTGLHSGSWDVSIRLDGGLAGPPGDRAILFSGERDGVPTGNLLSLEPPPDGFARVYNLRAILFFSLGQVITLKWGFGGVQAGAVLTPSQSLIQARLLV